jgi:hypothetical protein
MLRLKWMKKIAFQIWKNGESIFTSRFIPSPTTNKKHAISYSRCDGYPKKTPSICSHFEIETYTFNILPQSFKNRNVVEQLIGEYNFVINEFKKRGIT